MAQQKKDWRSRREDEEEKEKEILEIKRAINKKKGLPQENQDRDPNIAKNMDSTSVLEMIRTATSLIEQVDSLYNQYFSGAEKRPPHERRQVLDRTIETLQKAIKTTSELKFRFNSLQTQYTTYRDRWEKKLKDLENGKIKRSF